MVKAKLALANTFLDSFARLPKKQQKKVRELTERFEEDSTRSGLNFERIEHASDAKLRSLRVDQAYRVILVEPPKGNVLLCVWVDHHDDAYQWAKNKAFEINEVTGALQVYSVAEGGELPKEAPEAKSAEQPGLFDRLDEEELLLAGVPRTLLPSVRGLRYEHDLDDLAPHLPEDASEMLYLLAAGWGFMDALDEASRPREPAKKVDVEDFEKALEQPVTQRQFHVVEGEDELEAILDEPLEQWRLFLHPSQRQLVRMKANGPVRVLGGAGTGKTVVLMHRAKYLAKRVFNEPEDRILVTTFTRNLASDLALQLEKLCGPDFERVEVKNLHAWARAFYERQVGRKLKVLEDSAKRAERMEQAIAEAGNGELPAAFYLEEWDHVVQAQDVSTRDDYFHARRTGRGTRLGRKQRAEVWRVLARFRESMDQAGLLDWQDVVRETRLYIENNEVVLPYRAVLADEVQDFSANELQLLRALVPPGKDDLFVVGDAHQRIYGHMARLGACGIDIRGRGRRLRINYRTTEEIRNRAVAILEGVEIDDLDGGLDSMQGYRSLRTGPDPEVHVLRRDVDEQKELVALLRRWLEEVPAESICVAARTNALLTDRYAKILAEEGIPHVMVRTEPLDEGSAPGIRLATMHRLKGLEFHRVVIAAANKGVIPIDLPPDQLPDTASREDHERRERCLFYVASTRARDELVVLSYGQPSHFVSQGALA